MREEDDQFRRYAPLLQRIFILVAVVIAVPVVLLTITEFMRTYVAPPKVPTFTRISTATVVEPPRAASVAQDDSSSSPPAPTAAQIAPAAAPPPPLVEARATATDASSSVPKGPMLGYRAPDSNAGVSAGAPKISDATATPTPIPTNADSKSADSATPPPTPDGDATGSVIASQELPASTDASDDALPPPDPIKGPIPLPRHRPRFFSIAQAGVPMPRPRPRPDTADATPGTPETSDSPFGWLHNIFQQKILLSDAIAVLEARARLFGDAAAGHHSNAAPPSIRTGW